MNRKTILEDIKWELEKCMLGQLQAIDSKLKYDKNVDANALRLRKQVLNECRQMVSNQLQTKIANEEKRVQAHGQKTKQLS